MADLYTRARVLWVLSGVSSDGQIFENQVRRERRRSRVIPPLLQLLIQVLIVCCPREHTNAHGLLLYKPLPYPAS